MNLQNPVARFFLWVAGIPPETANQVQGAIPNIQALIRLSQEAAPTIKKIEAWYAKAKPLIDQGVPLINEAHPYVKRAIPLVEEAFDDWQEVAPAIYALLDSLRQQRLMGIKPSVAADNIANTLSAKYGFKLTDV